MSLFIVSDLHIRGEQDSVYSSLLRLLSERAQAGDTVVLAGDIFDLFVGDKELFKTRYKEFFRSIAQAGERGAQIHYIEGNHDFLVSAPFEGMRGVSVHSNELTLKLDGRSFYIAHGDLVDSNDVGYRALRAAFRSPPFRLLVKALPGAAVDWVGRKSSRYSRESRPIEPRALSTEKLSSLRKIYRSFAAEKLLQGHDFVVLGHCHDLDEMSFSIEGRDGQYINVGFPPVHGSFLSWDSGEKRIERERF